jgi:Domain of unknown function (DUF4375)
MAKKRELGEAYWAKIEGSFDSVDINSDPKLFLAQFTELETRTADLLAAHWCQSEVCNGGLYQFFHNSTGGLAPEAARAFEKIGIPEWAATLRQAMDYFGHDYVRNQQKRQEALPSRVKGQKREEWDPFFQLDEEFYRWLKLDQDHWNKLADAYAES